MVESGIYDKNFKFEDDIKPQQVILPRLPIKNDIFEQVENTCGGCFWFIKADNRYKFYEHYCRLHYMQEMRYKNEKACGDFMERGKDGI